ncbi:MAG: DUF4911 domain-containing protein [Peptococcaceae bacterium]|nr:DUF4911 domain-containing protein [Peptococcaceae bacterium]
MRELSVTREAMSSCLAWVRRGDINLLVRLVEGLGHLGVITTLDKERGVVLIQTTEDCRDVLFGIIEEMPVSVFGIRDMEFGRQETLEMWEAEGGRRKTGGGRREMGDGVRDER